MNEPTPKPRKANTGETPVSREAVVPNTQPAAVLEASLLGRRLRLAAFAVALLVITLVTGLHVSGNSPFAHLFGDDLLPSYMAGTFVRQGQPDLLTDLDAARRFQAHVRRVEGLEQHGRTGPWLNPPFYALPFVPLSALPYRAALWTWFGLNACLLLGSVWQLYRFLPSERRRPIDGITLGFLIGFSMPCLQAMACQQNTFLSLFLLTTSITLARKDRRFAAGAVAALLLFKPQLAVLVCGTLACLLGWQAIVAMAITAGCLLVAGEYAMPGSLADYLHKLPTLLPYLRTDRPYFWERQITPLGFWRLFVGGRTGGPNPPIVTLLYGLTAALVAAVLFRLIAWPAIGRAVKQVQRLRAVIDFPSPPNSRRHPVRSEGPGEMRSTIAQAGPAHRSNVSAAVGLTVLAAPLLMPYYMDYDLLLLAVPATLLAADRMANGRLAGGRRAFDRVVIALWATVYATLYVNAAVGDATRLSLAVPLLLSLFGLTAVRSRTERAIQLGWHESPESPVPPVKTAMTSGPQPKKRSAA